MSVEKQKDLYHLIKNNGAIECNSELVRNNIVENLLALGLRIEGGRIQDRFETKRWVVVYNKGIYIHQSRGGIGPVYKSEDIWWMI